MRYSGAEQLKTGTDRRRAPGRPRGEGLRDRPELTLQALMGAPDRESQLLRVVGITTNYVTVRCQARIRPGAVKPTGRERARRQLAVCICSAPVQRGTRAHPPFRPLLPLTHLTELRYYSRLM